MVKKLVIVVSFLVQGADCLVRKCTEHDYVTKELQVYHLGNHICELGVLKDSEDNQMKDFYESYEDYGPKR